MLFIIRIELENGNRYPAIVFKYELDEDGHGYRGTTSYWTDGNTKTDEEHTVSIRQASPLGKIFFTVDQIQYGAWATGSFEGVGIMERDLQWLSWFAVEAIKAKQVYWVL